MSILSEPHFHNEAAAIARLEQIVWPQGPFCPRCGGFDRITPVKGGRAGLRRCGPCKREFTVTVGTLFERSHVKLHKWFQAAHLLASSKKGISSHQLHRTLKVTYKTAWFMSHRLRDAMRILGVEPMGGAGQIVETDETLSGKLKGAPKHLGPGMHNQWRNVVMTLVTRGGAVRSFHVDGVTIATLLPIIRANIQRETGSIEGMLEQINIHEDANTFHIYPEVGPPKVTCRFPVRLFDDAVSAVGKRVEVFGTLRYRIGAQFPHQIAVSQIEALPPDSELPTWDDLRGRAPDATGGLSSEAYVRELRNGWR